MLHSSWKETRADADVKVARSATKKMNLKTLSGQMYFWISVSAERGPLEG